MFILNANKFTVGEQVKFDESGIQSILQGVTTGNFVDRTNNYTLDKGHKRQYSDYSKIVRKAKSAVPSKKLLIVFDKYDVQSGIVVIYFRLIHIHLIDIQKIFLLLDLIEQVIF